MAKPYEIGLAPDPPLAGRILIAVVGIFLLIALFFLQLIYDGIAALWKVYGED